MAPFSFAIDPKKNYELDLMFSVLYEPVITTYVFHITWHKPFYTSKHISLKEMTLDASFKDDWSLFMFNESEERQHVNKDEIIAVLYLLNITIDRRVRLEFVPELRGPE